MNNPQRLWTPSPQRIEAAGLTRYRKWLKKHRGLDFPDYESLWQWSVTEIEAFWGSMWDFNVLISHQPYKRVLDRHAMPGAKWFEGATLNYAEHSLVCAREPGADRKAALVAYSEARPRIEVSWAQLASQVGALTATLEAIGLNVGDRAVAYLPNIPEAVAALLAVASRGAIWSSASPDMGPVSVLDRFRQIEPKVLFAVDGYRYGGKDFDRREIVRELVRELPTLEAVIFVPYLNSAATLELPEVATGRAVHLLTFADATARARPPKFTPVPFDHPLWIVYSSGTTGMPKPIVHSHGGITIQNLKAGTLHLDLRADDRFFWFSSTSWIIWNLLVNVLQTGATIIQFDGNPGHPDLTNLWHMAERERVTFFGTSPAFISLCMKSGIDPRAQFDLSPLRSIGCTGSPLTEDGYRWIYEHVHPDVMLACISGGTDICACFLSACPTLPVYAGELTCRELGVATHAFDDDGQPVMDQVGELVMTKPIPSMPIYFWGDKDGKRYFESYFDTYPDIWRHGDWLRLTQRPGSVTAVVYGRSDSTINRHGIRMGTSEFYRVVEEFPEIADSLVIDLEYLGRESFLALFVVLRDAGALPNAEAVGHAAVNGDAAAFDFGVPRALRAQLLQAIRKNLSARHVPNEVFAVPQVPRTLTGKKMEVPVKKILLGQSIEKSVNRDSMANPGSIDWFVSFARGRNKSPAAVTS